jgi:hypothetical protein
MNPGLAARTKGAATACICSSRQPIAIAATHGAQPAPSRALATSRLVDHRALAIDFHHPPSSLAARPWALPIMPSTPVAKRCDKDYDSFFV